MGLLSKAWKGIKKTVKKIGKRIKKTFKSVMKGIGKLGIVGQIGMMFLMPYAMGALGSLFGTAGKLATWSSKLLGPNSGFLSKALGKTLEMVNVGGTWIKNAYTSVSTAISNSLNRVGNFLKSGKFELSPDRTSVFSADFKSSLDTLPTSENVKQFNLEQVAAKANAEVVDVVSTSTSTETPPTTTTTDVVPREDAGVVRDVTGTVNGYENKPYGTVGDVTTGVDADYKNFSESFKDLGDDLIQRGKDFLGDINILDPDSQIRKDIFEFNPYEYIEEKVDEGVAQGIRTEAMYAITGKPGDPIINYNTRVVPNVIGMGTKSNISLGQIDDFMSPLGNNWQAQSMAYSPYVNAQLNPGDDVYKKYMGVFGFDNASSMLEVDAPFRQEYKIYG